MTTINTLTIEDGLDQSYAMHSPFNVRPNFELPAAARSALRSAQASLLSGGITEVISQLLLGKLTLKGTATVTIVTASGEGTGVAVYPQGTSTLTWYGHTGSWKESVMLALACALTTTRLPHTKASLHHLVQALATAGLRYPFTAASLHAAVSSQPILHALGALADTLDAEVRQLLDAGTLHTASSSPQGTGPVQDLALAELLYPPRPPTGNGN